MRFVGNKLSAKVGFGEPPAIVDIAAPLSFHMPHDIITALRPPLGCFDERGVELSPDDSVFAYPQVFSFAGRSNANPSSITSPRRASPSTRPKGSRSTMAPDEAGEGMLWAVLHDNRGGVSWASVPLHVR